MYRWFSHRRFPDSTRPTGKARHQAGANLESRRHHQRIIIDLTVLRQRILALSFLSLFLISSLGSWHLPATTRPAKVVSHSVIAVGGSESSPTAIHVKHGFRFRLDGKAESKPPKKSSSLYSETETEIRSLISLLNQAIDLPSDVELSFEDCKHSDAYYDEDLNRVIICHQWLDEMERVLSRRLSDKTVVHQSVQSVAAAVFLHETAHALIDILDLPITGREEDAADQFSTLVLLSRKDGVRKAMQVASTYRILSQDAIRFPEVYWGEHSLNIQRYYDTLCMVYGRNPKENLKFLDHDPLPDERADICESEYKRIENSWKRLLQGHTNPTLWQTEPTLPPR